MTQMEAHAISYVFERIDEVGAQLVANTYHHLVNQYADLFYILTSIFIGFCFINMKRGKMTADDLLINVFRAVLILTLALNYDNFCFFFYDVLTNAPLNICKAITIEGGNVNPLSISHALDQFLQQGAKVANGIWLLGSWTNPTYFVFSIIMHILVMLTAGMAAGLIVLAKCMSTILFALSPIFLILALFNATKGLFDSFLSQLLTYALIPILTCAILMMLLSVSNAAIQNFNQHVEPNFVSLIPLSLICVIQIYLLMHVPSKCANLAGGFSLPSVVNTLHSAKQNVMHSTHAAKGMITGGTKFFNQAQKTFQSRKNLGSK